MPRSSQKLPPLWRCPECGRGFANRNQSHSCSNVSLESHFAGKSQHVRDLFDALAAMIKKCGPVKVLPEKTRIAFQVQMAFIAVQVRRNYLLGHFVLRDGLSIRGLRVSRLSLREITCTHSSGQSCGAGQTICEVDSPSVCSGWHLLGQLTVNLT